MEHHWRTRGGQAPRAPHSSTDRTPFPAGRFHPTGVDSRRPYWQVAEIIRTDVTLRVCAAPAAPAE
jgi:hypothetical protein